MEFTEGGIYKPIVVLLNTHIYEQALKICWDINSYKAQIALLTELLRLQQKRHLPSEVTAEDMTELLLEQSKYNWRAKLWLSELEDFEDCTVKSLLKLVWKVNNSMRMRDVEFEAIRLLNSPETIPPILQHPRIICQAGNFARRLLKQQQEAPSFKLLSPQEVVIEVLTKVLQGFWLPPPNTFFNMPSRELSKVVVGTTKAAQDRVFTALPTELLQVAFSRSVRDKMVQSIQERVRQSYTQDILVIKLKCFAADVLKTIIHVAADEICLLFQPQSDMKMSVNLKSENDFSGSAGVEEDTQPIRKTDSAVITSPPSPLITAADAPANTVIQRELNSSTDEAMEKETPSREPGCAVISAQPATVSSPAAATACSTLAMDDSVTSVDQNELTIHENEAKMKTEGENQGFCDWFRQTLCCCCLPQETD